MGAGDFLMATSQVRRLNEKYGLPVVVFGPTGRRMWHEVFDHNPRLTKSTSSRFVRLINGPGERPYILRKRTDRWTWQKWDIAPGELYLTQAERIWAAREIAAASAPGDDTPILIEPNIKGTNEGNKAWLWDRWQALVDRYPRGTFVQVGRAGARRLDGVAMIATPSFRLACAVLSQCRACVGTEGGLHHAAAALGVPAVVLFAEFISPEVTGYAAHRNLYHGTHGLGCGNRMACEGCRASMLAITVDEVDSNLRGMLDEARARLVVPGPREASTGVDVGPEESDGPERTERVSGQEAARSA
jgi:hypothetical protein